MAVGSMQGSELELTDNTGEETDVRPAQFRWCNRYSCTVGRLLGIVGLIVGLSCPATAAPGPGTSFDNKVSIVGGDDAKEGSWPFMVSLQSEGKHFCGGSLINSEWILTAGHCIAQSLNDLRVVLGKLSLMAGPPGVSRGVAEIVPHPKFKFPHYDVALLRLTSPVSFNYTIKPVCLAATGSVFSHGTPSWVIGWGNIGKRVPLPYPKVLQQVQVPVVDNESCNRSYEGNITNNMICAGLQEGGKDSCQGDSGGPMISHTQPWDEWVQSGVVSWGWGCARPGLPGVYARVDRFEEWIRSIVKTGLCLIQFVGSSSTCPGLPDLADLDPRYLANIVEE